jgi:hypothetical protein
VFSTIFLYPSLRTLARLLLYSSGGSDAANKSPQSSSGEDSFKSVINIKEKTRFYVSLYKFYTDHTIIDFQQQTVSFAYCIYHQVNFQE